MMVPEIKTILYATDLSDNSRPAFHYAASLAEKYGAKMTVLHVIEEFGASTYLQISGYLGEVEWQKLLEDRENKLLDHVTERLNEFCSEMNTKLDACKFILGNIITKRGIAVEEILKQAKEIDADMIVMGTHGYNAFADALLGGTARRVVRRSQIPVLVVRQPETEESTTG
ncbi:MAG: universal stress protein [Desulfobacteraceae bacterium]|nr:universal stress protein [Desulfobacteraceae bacterium]